MNTKLAIIAAALLAIAPAAYAQDSGDATGNTSGGVGDTSPSDTTISGSGEADNADQHGDNLMNDGAASDLEEISPAAGSDYFDQWDTDQDGSLSEDEFRLGFEQYQMENQ